MQILLIAIACLGPLVAVVFGCHALWHAMANLYSTPIASAVLAGVWLGVASLAAVVALIIRARRRRKKAALAAAAAASGAPAAGGLASMLSTALPGGLATSAPKALATLELAMANKPIQTTALLISFGALVGRKPAAVVRLARMAAGAR